MLIGGYSKREFNKAHISTMGRLFIAILLIVVFEGAIRKWISPAFTNPMVLLRDTLALYGLYWAIKTGKMNSRQVGAKVLWLWSAFVLVWGLIQVIVNQPSPIVYIIGIRFWLLYLWFAYAAAVSMTQDDFRYICKTLFWLLLVMAPLAVVQFSLPPSAFLNKQVGGDVEKVFLVIAGVVRTTGTFTFTIGYTTLIAMISPFVLSAQAPGTKLWGSRWAPKILLLTLAVATIVSGSRAALIMFGAMFLAYFYISIHFDKASLNSRRKSSKKKSILMLTGVILMLSIVPYIFSDAVDVSAERFESASQSEDITERIITIFLGESAVYEDLPILGAGIGAGTNFASALATGERSFMLAETEVARTILEGGLLGYAFIGLKLIVIIFGLIISLRIAKKTGNTLPLLIWIALVVALLTWSIIGQLTVNAIGYLFLSLGLASLRFKDKQWGN